MSSGDKKPPVDLATQHGQQQYFPPPPGPPPVQTAQTQAPKHPNETPIPDYDNPSRNHGHPQFVPPPTTADDDIYGATPTDKHGPKWGHHHQQDHHQHHEGGGEAGKKKTSKFAAFGAAFSSKVAGPVNALANKFGSEGFLPESLDKECEKAARILRGFCKDGIYSEVVPPTAPTTTGAPTPNTIAGHPQSGTNKPKKPRVLLTIPSKVIARAQGLAIFTAVRIGFQATGSSGSGVLLARLPDGSWSPPSGVQITSIGAGFVAGVDIYDCVIVINTREALELFTKTRLSLGSDLAVTAGPFGAGGALDWGVPAGERQQKGKGKEKDGEHQKHADTLSQPQLRQQHPLSADNTHFQTGPVPEDQQGMGEEDAKEKARKDRQPSPFREAIKKPVYSYVKSRGLFAGVQIDGTVIAEREGANARFYGQAVPVGKILKGEVPAQGPPGMWPVGARVLFDVLRGAEGWRGQQQGQQGRPVSPVSPGFAAPVTTAATAAPPNAWAAPPPPIGVSGVAAGMQAMSVGPGSSNATAGPSSTFPGAAPPPAQTVAASAKATEAAAEAARAEHSSPPPPMYSEAHGAEDLPPAYVEDENRRHVGGDSKTGQH